MNDPVVYIVTVSFNNVEGLKKTKCSIDNLEYSFIRWIVIDGGSNDGTVDYLENISVDYPLVWVSEKDSGIYNAMNKSSDYMESSDGYVIFMNSGDEFYSSGCLSKVFETLHLEHPCTLITGGAHMVKEDGSSYFVLPRSPSKAWTGMPSSHQSMLFGVGFFKKYLYDESFSLGGDYDLYCKAVASDANSCYTLDEIICNFYLDGVSVKKRKFALKENYLTRRRVLGMGGVSAALLYALHYFHMKLKLAFPNVMVRLRRITS